MSPAAYEYAKAVYSMSNRQAADRIDAVVSQINDATENGELPTQEAEWLIDLCEDCRAGRWDDAQAGARRMMEDQVRH